MSVHDYFNVFNCGGMDFRNALQDETNILIEYLKGEIHEPRSRNIVKVPVPLEGMTIRTKPEHLGVYSFFYLIGYAEDSEINSDNLEFDSDSPTVGSEFTIDMLFPNLLYYPRKASILFCFFKYDPSEFQDNHALFDEPGSIAAFGMMVEIDENADPFDPGGSSNPGDEPDEDIPNFGDDVQPFDPDSTQSIRVLYPDTLEEYSTVPDVYNVKISQQINGFYNLTFILLPYTNASNIYTPRIVECDDDYFHVQQITKRRQLNNLEMDIECEHVSYELNYPPSEFFDDEAGKHVWTEDNYVGTAREILEEMLSYNGKFTIGLVDDNAEHDFVTSTEGFRSRINEFANYIGLEVKWNKFTVSLLRQRGHDNGLTLEVGKNIIGLTEIIDTVKLGKTRRSYELDVIDLTYTDEDLSMYENIHNISIGDVVTIIDPNYGINRKDRVVGLTRDPFKKALPTIELENNLSSFAADSSKGMPAAVGNVNMEYGTFPVSSVMDFTFKEGPYSEIGSVTTGVSGDEELTSPLILTSEPIKNGEGKYVKLRLYASNITDSVYVCIQAICVR